MLDGFLSDLRFGLRFYRRNPAFAALAVGILAVGIGSTTALFSVVDAVLLRPLPFAAPEQLVDLWEDYAHHGLPRNTPAAGNFTDWRAQARSFTDIAASNQHSASLTGEGRPEAALGRRVTENLFDVLGVQAALGRTLGTQDAAASGSAGTNEPVVVISDGLWRRRFGGDVDVVGRTLRLDGVAHTIVGVMPRGFAYPSTRHDYWVPARWTPEQAASRRSHNLQVVGRLRPGVTLDAARSEMKLLAERVAKEHPDNAGRGVVVVPLAEDMVGQARSTLPVLLAAAGLLLLIGCANVANLLLAKAVGRRGEMALRQALGAGRGRLVRQTLAESLLLGLAAGALGVLLARLALGLVEQLVPLALAGVPVELDGRVLLLAVGLSLSTAILFGIAPAIALAVDPWRRLGRARGAGGGVSEGRLRDLMVVAEVALALVLLVGAGLAVRSLAALTAVDIGFRSERLLTLSTRLPRTAYTEPARRLAFYDRVLEQARALPGVERAAYTSNLPFTSRGNSTSFAIEGRPLRDGEVPDVLYRVATADYLETLGLRLLEGRFYGAADSATSEPVVVINDTMRRRFFADASPLGRRLQIADDTWRTIIGVVADAKETGLEGSARSGSYLPVVQNATAWAIPEYLVVRTAGDPMTLAPALRQVIWSVDPEQPISELREMQGWVDRDLAERRGQRGILSAFSGLALGLAALGIYGVLAYSVSRRRREIGVRMALGATPRDVALLIGWSAMRLVAAGLAIGTAVALVATRLMSSSLYEVRASDPLTYIGVVGILALVGAAAALLPTRQATAIEPASALRDD